MTGVQTCALPISLLVVAFVGTINPSAGGTSVFVPIEHAVLSGAVGAKSRTHAFARYSLLGALAGALALLYWQAQE